MSPVERAPSSSPDRSGSMKIDRKCDVEAVWFVRGLDNFTSANKSVSSPHLSVESHTPSQRYLLDVRGISVAFMSENVCFHQVWP